MIAKLSYVMCDGCGNPAQAGDSAKEARAIARREGFARRRVNGKMRDLCWNCKGDDDHSR